MHCCNIKYNYFFLVSEVAIRSGPFVLYFPTIYHDTVPASKRLLGKLRQVQNVDIEWGGEENDRNSDKRLLAYYSIYRLAVGCLK